MQKSETVYPRAAVSAAIFREDAVLLVRRARPPAEGLWSFPGGHIEPGEPAEDAVHRELMEETGVLADLAGLLDVRDAVHRNDRGDLLFHRVIVVFYGVWRSGEARAASDASQAGWFASGDMAGLATTDGLPGMVEEARRRLVGDGDRGAQPAIQQ